MIAEGVSRTVESNQNGIHEKLDELVARYRQSTFARPISDHTQQAFDSVYHWLTADDRPLVVDACCGVGESTARIAQLHPDAKVLGVDKSAHRLDKHHAYAADDNNYRVIRADLNDFWRLLVNAGISAEKQYLLYPNPYPKSAQIQKRWYASAVMPYLMKVSPRLEVRSNWQLYLQEFAIAAKQYGFDAKLSTIVVSTDAMTPFERKYTASGQACYQLVAEYHHD